MRLCYAFPPRENKALNAHQTRLSRPACLVIDNTDTVVPYGLPGQSGTPGSPLRPAFIVIGNAP